MRNGEVIWWNGQLVPWHEAQVHVTSETALRGLNVFEGLRGYWRPQEQAFAIVGLPAHLNRLTESARSLLIPVLDVPSRFTQGIKGLLRSVASPCDVYIRPTIYVNQGAYDLDPTRIRTGEFISLRRAPSRTFPSVRCGVSSWIRIPPRCLPSTAKIGATYTAFRLARLEVMARGCGEAILLNEQGRVAETGGGSVFCVKDSIVLTPPLDTGILPSITRRVVLETLCPQLGIRTDARPIELVDLKNADEVFIAGTLDEIVRVTSVDETSLSDSPNDSVVGALQGLYRSLCDGSALQESEWVDIVGVEGLKG